MKYILLFILCVSTVFGQSDRRFRTVIIDSLKALNGSRIDVKDTVFFEKPLAVGGVTDTSAFMTITSTDRGILIPRMTAAQRVAIAGPAEGLLVYDIDSSSFWYFSSGWQKIGSGGGGLTITGNDNEIVRMDGTADLQSSTWKIEDDSTLLPPGIANIGDSLNRVDTIYMSNIQHTGLIVESGQVTLKGADASSVNYSLKVQDNVGTDNLTVRNDGNVGIHEVSPQEDLDFGSSINTDKIYLWNGSNKFGFGIQASDLRIYGSQVDFGKYDGTTYTSSGTKIDGFTTGNITLSAGNVKLTGSSNRFIGGSVTKSEVINLFESGTSKYGMGVKSAKLRIYTPASQFITFEEYDGVSTFVEAMRVDVSNKSVGIGGTIATDAILDLTATDKALLLTRLLSEDSILTPVNAMLIYDNTDDIFKGYANGIWIEVARDPSFVTLTDGATITWDREADGYNVQVTLGGNRTLSITNVQNGMYGTIKVIQDATGSRTLTLPVNSKVANGGGGSVTLSTAANAIDVLTWFYDGTDFYWSYGLNYN